MEIKELKDFEALDVYSLFWRLAIAVHEHPRYRDVPWEKFYAQVQDEFTDDQKKILIIESIMIGALTREELESCVSFTKDKNGVTYNRSNIKNLNPAELIEIVSEVLLEVSKIRVKLVNESEKKNSRDSVLISEKPMSEILVSL